MGNELFYIDYEGNSTKEEESVLKLSVFPNPALSSIALQHPLDQEPLRYYIYDLQGRLLQTELPSEIIDVSQLDSGIYFIHSFYKNGTNAMCRFVIK